MKHVLLAVVGLSPQVITEAVYALFHEGQPVDAIHCVATGIGAGEIYRTLLAPAGGPLEELCRQYGIDRQAIHFGHDTLHVLCMEDGTQIDDISSEDHNERLLEKCLELTHRFTTDPDTRVSFLVAGGRKTMTSCLTLAAQLYGRRRDRLYHVLVSPEFESCRSFWFPPRESKILKLTDARGEPIYKETRFAEINLIPIPFVSIRNRIDAALLDRPRSPADLMQSLVRGEEKKLLIDTGEKKIVYGATEMDMPPSQLALYCFFAEIKKNCGKEKSCAACAECWLEVTEVIEKRRIHEIYRLIPNARVPDVMEEGCIGRLNSENFRSYRSKINKRLLRSFGRGAMHELEIAAWGEKPDTRYGIRLDKDRIRIIGI